MNLKRRDEAGFALVVALTLMGFVLLLSITLVSLVRMETASAGLARESVIARQNALFGLRQALGELQVVLGPDQRVSATAGLLPNTAPNKANTTGVWVSDPNGSSVHGTNYGEGDLVRWLASDAVTATGAASLNYNQVPAPAIGANNSVVLLGAGSLEDADSNGRPDDLAQAVVVDLSRSTVEENDTTTGYYAWWIGDEGVKARVNLSTKNLSAYEDAKAKKQASILALNQSDHGDIRGVSEGDFSHLDIYSTGLADRIHGEGQLKIAASRQGITGAEDKIDKRFHDLTYWSRGVLADARNGGLKDDLSLAFEMSDSDFNSSEFGAGGDYPISVYGFGNNSLMTQPLFVKGGALGPSWSLLRDYYRLYHRVQTPMNNPTLTAQDAFPSLLDILGAGVSLIPTTVDNWVPTVHPVGLWGRGSGAGGTLNGYSVNLATQGNEGDTLSQNRVTPTMTRGSYWPYLNRYIEDISLYFVKHKDSTNTYPYVLYIQDATTAVFHNPYNVRLVMPETWMSTGQIMRIGAEVEVTDGDGNVTTPSEHRVLVDSVLAISDTFEPGELKYRSGRKNMNGVTTWNTPSNTHPDWSNSRQKEVGLIHVPDGAAAYSVTFTPLVADSGSSIQYSIFGNGMSSTGLPVITDKKDIQQKMALLDYVQMGAFTLPSGWGSTTDGVDFGANDLANYTAASPWNLYRTELFIKPSGTDYPYPPFVLTNPTGAMNYGPNMMPETGTGFPIFTPDRQIRVESLQGNMSSTNPGRWGTSNEASGQDNVVLIDLPTSPPLSLGKFQNANITTVGYMPAMAIGNSFASPYIPWDQTVTTFNNWNNRSRLFYDLSYLSNEALWDRYFFSSYSVPYNASADDYDASSDTPGDSFDAAFNPDYSGNFATGSLPNRRMSLLVDRQEDLADVRDKLFDANGAPRSGGYRRSAENLMVEGAFNVNSASVEAWVAVLSSARGMSVYGRTTNSPTTDDERTPISRLSQPLESAYTGGNDESDEAWAGFRHLTDAQIRTLAECIVEELKLRADEVNGGRPYLSLADFVNRSLTNEDYHSCGLLQAAIDKSGLNDSFNNAITRVSRSDLSSANFPNPDAIKSGDADSRSASAMAPGYILQGDLLTSLGSAMSVRSDTFRIRAYGNFVDPLTNRVKAQAWCEAIVQRVPAPAASVTGSGPDDADYWEPQNGPVSGRLGRRFEIVEFRWLNKEDV
ncbi:hypothetical protein H5P28_05275 [Ruficoccus amylovorans]|uniref:Uncharacterized protein n=1 Tax=Ruficoccus amylovorans TaxID=1804625 RepID=A0A842HBX2_9BACT|nr:hypothetical protein [Ruficoccus amylovorans]MBC2593669.1 hypothetical protein [Ruficoccus amylovorans]